MKGTLATPLMLRKKRNAAAKRAAADEFKAMRSAEHAGYEHEEVLVDDDDELCGSACDSSDSDFEFQRELHASASENSQSSQDEEDETGEQRTRGLDSDSASSGEESDGQAFAEDIDEQNAFNALPIDREQLLELIHKLVNATRKGSTPEMRKNYSRKVLLRQLEFACAKYFAYNLDLARYFIDLFGPEEALSFFTANERNLPVTIRTNYLRTRRKKLAQTLISRGCKVDVVGDWCRTGLLVTESSVPIGATPEYLAGHYMIMAASSFTPVIALEPKPNERVLDMCAAPGGKSAFMAEYMQNTGVLVCNDLNKSRLASLTANLHRLGVVNSVVVNYDARRLGDNCQVKFDRILLDAPCSGSGVFCKDAEAKLVKTQKDFAKMANLQRELILTAIDLLDAKSKTGGVMVYSTCSVSVEENEAVINFALKHRHIKILDLQFGFGRPGLTTYKKHRFDRQVAKCMRIYPHVNNMHGFFVCKIKKLSDAKR